MNLLETADEFYTQGNLREALKIYESLLQEEKNESEIGTLQNNIGLCYYSLEEYDLAENYFKLFLQTLNDLPNPSWNDIAIANSNIGDALSAKLEKEKAISYYKTTLKIYQNNSDEIVEGMITQNTNIGHCFYYQNKYNEAESYYFSAKENAEKFYGTENERTNLCRFDLAENLYYQGKIKEAFKKFSEVYYFFEDENQYVNKIDVLNHLTNLSFELPANHLHKNYFLQLLAECELVHGNESVDTAIALKKLGRFYLTVNDYKKASHIFEKALLLFSKIKGEIHDETIKVAFFLADTYFKCKQFKKSKEISAYILSVERRKQRNSDFALINPIANLALACFKCNDFSNAEKLYEEALSICEKAPEKFSSDIKTYKIYLADSLKKSGQHAKAAEKLKRFIESEKNSSPVENFLPGLYSRLAENLAHIKNKAPEAELFYLKSIDFLKNQNDFTKLNEERLKLAALYRKKFHQINKTLAVLNEITSDLENRDAQNSLVYFKAQTEIGNVLNSTRNHKKTITVLTPLFDLTKEKDLIPDNWKIRYFKFLGEAELVCNNREEALEYFLECYRLAEKYYGKEDGNTKFVGEIIDASFPENKWSTKENESLDSNRLLTYNRFIQKELHSDLKRRNVRVFISSTFRDMMAERDYLMKNVFPEIKQSCKEYGIDFTEIDLRWGVTNEEAEQGKVIEICLNEIDKSRPYFIGILGERYGWVPDETVRFKIEKTLENFQWLHQDFQDKLSITEMEIQYGVLRNQKMKGNAFFYLRHKNITPENPDFFEKENSNEHKKLQQLKQILKEQSEYPVHEFDSLKKLGELIAHDLQQAIIRDTKLEQKLTPILKFRVNQINHIKQHSDFYIPQQKSLKKLDDLVNENTNKIVIYSPQGKGKTAFLSHWIRKIFGQKNNIPLLFHLTGASSEYAIVSALFWNISEELSTIFNFENDYNPDNENHAQELLRILKKVDNSSRVIIVIDGIENIKANPFYSKLYWLPIEIPQNITVVISTNSSDFLEILQKRNFLKITIDSLSKNQRTDFITKYLQLFGKKLPENLLEKLAGNTISKSPSTLKVVLNELRLMGKHEDLELELNKFLASKNTNDLYAKVLERMELDFEEDSPGLFPKILSLLACSKLGLSEQEMMDLTQSARLYLSPILLSLEDYLKKTDSLISIENTMFVEAVQQKYLSREKVKNEIKNILVHHLFEINDVKRKATELAPLLFELNDKNRLRTLFTEIPVFTAIIYNDLDATFKYFQYIKDEFDVIKNFRKNLEKEKQSNVLKTDLINQLIRISGFFSFNQCYDECTFFTEEAYRLARNIYGENHAITAKTLTTLAGVYSNNEDDSKAKKTYQKAIRIFENSTFDIGGDLATAYSMLAKIHIRENNLQEAKVLTERTRKFLESKYGENNIGLAETYKLRGEIELKNKNFSLAETWVKKALNLLETYFQHNSLIYLSVISALIDIYEENDEIEKSLDLLLEMESTIPLKLGKDHFMNGAIKFSIASKYFQKKDIESAEKKAKETINLAEKFEQSNEEYAIHTNDLIGKIQRIRSEKIHSEKRKDEFDLFLQEKQKQLRKGTEKSNKDFKAEMDNFEENLSSDNYKAALQNLKDGIQFNSAIPDNKIKIINMARINLNTGKMYYYNEDYKNGITCFNDALKTFNENNFLPEIAECLTFLADSYYFLEDFYKAISNRLQVVSIHENTLTRDEKKLAQIYYDLALDYYRNEQEDKSVLFAQKSIELRTRLFGIDTEETDEARFLLGKAYYYQDMIYEARECFRATFIFRKKHFGTNSKEVEVVKEWLTNLGLDEE